MNLILKTIKVRNFLSFEDEEFDFESNSGLTLITGKNLDVPGSKNGCGKSSLINAVAYALFGKLSYASKNENIMNWFSTEKNMEVELRFIACGNEYRISSGIRSRSSFCLLYKIEADGSETDMTKSTIQETRKFVANELLHSDIDIFLRYCILNSDPSANFFNLEKKDRDKLFDTMFNLGVLARMYNLIHDDKKTVDRKLALKNTELMSANRYDDEYKELNEGFEKTKSEKLSRLASEVTSLETELAELTKNPMANNVERIAEFTTKIKKIEKRVDEFNSHLRLYDCELGKSRQAIKSNKSAIKILDEDISKLKKVVPELCEDCLGKYKKTYNLEQIEQKKRKYENDTEANEAKIVDIEKRSKEVSEAKVKFMNKRNELLADVRNDTSAYQTYTYRVNDLTNRINVKKMEINTTNSSTNPYVDMLMRNMEKKNALLEEQSSIKRELSRTASLDKMFQIDGVKKYIASHYINVINTLVNNYLCVLEAPCEIKFDSDMDYKFITTRETVNPEYRSFSSGEQVRIMMAVCFAFRDFLSKVCNVSCNALFIDEFIDGNIDAKGIECTQGILQKFADSGQSVYVVSHRPELDTTKFNTVVEVIKQDNISHIEIKKM